MKFMSIIFKTFVSLLILIGHVEIGYAQTASILPNAKTTYTDQNGKPLVSGTVDFYIPGTTTRKMTWKDAGQSVPNANPVLLDGSGRATILGDGSYRQVVKDRYGNIIWDAYTSSAGSGGGGATPTVGDGDAVGTVKAWSGFTAPYGYAFAYGQELVRTSYPEAFAVLTSQQNVSCTSGSSTLTGVGATTQLPIGAPIESACLNSGATIVSKTTSTVTASSNAIISTTTTARFFPFGNGDGSLTFNVPDLRGRVIAGNDIMGGIAANRLTSTYFGVSADALGANGGNQSQTLSQSNLPNISPSFSGINTIITSTSVNSVWANAGGVQGINATAGATVFALNPSPPPGVSSVISSASYTPSGTISALGSGTAFANIQPTQTYNYIIKVIPDTNPNSFFGVASLGGMYGVINCGFGITCAGNTISSVSSILNPPQPTVLGGIFQSNAPANKFAIGVDLAGNVLYSGGATTVNGQTCTIGSSCTITASAGTITVGVTTISGGNINGLLYKDNAGLLASAGTGNNGIIVTNGSGVPSISTANAVSNTLLTQVAAATLKGNPSSITSNVQDFTIQSLTGLTAPDATLDLLPIYDHTTGTIKNISPSNLGSGSGATTIANIAALKALSPGISAAVYVNGYSTSGDGGQGWFSWNGASVIADNSCTIFQPSAGGTGRWVRQMSVPTNISVAWCGVAPGSGADLGATLNNIVTNILPASGGVITLPGTSSPGTPYTMTTTFVTKNSVKIQGVGGVEQSTSNNTPVQIQWSGSNASTTRIFDLRDSVANIVDNVTFVVPAAYAGIIVDIGATVVSTKVAYYPEIRNSSFYVQGTFGTGLATCIMANRTIEWIVSRNQFTNCATAIQGRTDSDAYAIQSTSATITNNQFYKNTAAIASGGHGWNVTYNTFEGDASGKAQAYNQGSLKTVSMYFAYNWMGDVTTAGGSWFNINSSIQSFTIEHNFIGGEQTSTDVVYIGGGATTVVSGLSISSNTLDTFAAAAYLDTGIVVRNGTIQNNAANNTTACLIGPLAGSPDISRLSNSGFTTSCETQLLGSNGYMTQVNGVLEQWGTNTVTGGTPLTITFAKTFPSACYNAQATLLSPAAGTNTSYVTSACTTTGMTLNVNGTGANIVQWRVIGR